MRSGRIFRRCGKCNRAIARGSRLCPCGSKSASWGYVVDVSSPGAPRRQRMKVGFRTAEGAQQALTRVQASKGDGTYVEPSRLTVGRYLTSWLAGQDRLRASTRTSYAIAARKLEPLIGGVLLQSLTKTDVRAAYAALTVKPTNRGKPPAVKTIHLVHLALHAALEDALNQDLVNRNVADGAHQAPKAGESPEMQVWTAPQILSFLHSCESDPLHPLFWLAAYTGMRRGEVLGLRWGDLNLDEGFLSVRQQISRRHTETGDIWDAVPPKTAAGRRRVDLDPETVGLLRRHKASQTEHRVKLGPAYADADLIFARLDGHFLDPDSVTGIFEKLGRRTRLPRVRFHDLRHSHATILLMGGAPVHLVAQRLGHASPMVTLKVYAHVVPGGQAAAAAQFAAAIANG